MYQKIRNHATNSNKKHYFIEIILAILLVFSFTVIFYQHKQIVRLSTATIYQSILDKKLLSQHYAPRIKRSIYEDTSDINNDSPLSTSLFSAIEYSVNAPTLPNYSAAPDANKLLNTNYNNQPYFVPLYAQLLPTELEKLCQKKFGNIYINSQISNQNSKILTEIPDEELSKNQTNILNRYKSPKINQYEKRSDENKLINSNYHLYQHRKSSKEKTCAQIRIIGSPRLIGERIYHSGAVMKRGSQWLLTEYHTGNTLFQFDSTRTDEDHNNNVNYNLNMYNDNNVNNRKYNSNIKETKLNFKTNEFFHFEQLKNNKRRSTNSMLFKYPTKIHTLSEPFYGTDHTVAGLENDLIFYYVISSDSLNEESRIQAIYLSTGRRITKLLNAATGSLYAHKKSKEQMKYSEIKRKKSANDYNRISAIDLEVDQNALWVLYQKPNILTLSVSKMALNSLKELAQWHLNQIYPNNYLNAFVSCGIFYTLSTKEALINKNNTFNNENAYDYNNWRQRRHLNAKNSTIFINAVFDFNTEQYFTPPRLTGVINFNNFSDDEVLSISNAQYDPISDSLNIFNNGKIYSISIKRKRF